MPHKILVPSPCLVIAEANRRESADWPCFGFIGNRHKTTEQAVGAGDYDRVDGEINSRNFPLRPRFNSWRTIQLIEFDYVITSSEVLSIAEKFKLERPLYEDAFDFGELYPREQKIRRIVFPHEPWGDPSGNLKIMALDGDANRRNLGLRSFSARCKRGCAFAFVRVV